MTTATTTIGSELTTALLDEARWAPSGDNEQPWRVRVRGNSLEVMRAPAAEEAFLDLNLEATRIAMGAFAESLRLAATARGREARLGLASDVSSPVWATVVVGTEGAPREEALAGALTKRCSNRKLFEPTAWSDDDTRALVDACRGQNEVDVQIVTDRAVFAPLARAVGAADYVRMGHARCTAEFHQKIHWSEAEARAAQTGFFWRSFEIKPHESLALKLTKNPTMFAIIKKVMPLQILAARLAERQVVCSGAIATFSMRRDDPCELAEVGRSLLRVWLAAHNRGIQAQVLGVLPLFLRQLAVSDGRFTAAERTRLERARSLWAQVPGLPPCSQTRLMMRLGRGPAPSARTYRLPPERLLIDG